MPVYVYPDRIEFPNYSLRIDDAGVRVTTPTSTTANGTFTSASIFYKSHFQGQVAGYTSGGQTGAIPGDSNTIDRFPFATNANATDFGDLSSARVSVTGQSSTVSGYTSGGTLSNQIDKFPFATNITATDIGDLTSARALSAGQSSTVSGYTSGGDAPTPGSPHINIIDKFPFATDANATDVGDLTVSRLSGAGQSSTDSGYTSGGTGPSPGTTNTIDKFPFATNANATDVGDTDVNNSSTRFGSAGQSSGINGYISGGSGVIAPSPINYIEKFPFATNANAKDVGDLTNNRMWAAGQSSVASGYTSGGGAPFPSPTPSFNNTIDKFPFATDANATDVGDLSSGRQQTTGQQY